MFVAARWSSGWQAGRPDWTSFSFLGDFFSLGVFLKIK
jgi:hypothetical protein